jgi:hypothetical protein
MRAKDFADFNDMLFANFWVVFYWYDIFGLIEALIKNGGNAPANFIG